MKRQFVGYQASLLTKQMCSWISWEHPVCSSPAAVTALSRQSFDFVSELLRAETLDGGSREQAQLDKFSV